MAAPSSPIIRAHAPSGTPTAAIARSWPSTNTSVVRPTRLLTSGVLAARSAPVLRAHAPRGTRTAASSRAWPSTDPSAVRVPDGAWERMMGDDGAAIAAEVKALGFRYMALDLSVA